MEGTMRNSKVRIQIRVYIFSLKKNLSSYSIHVWNTDGLNTVNVSGIMAVDGEELVPFSLV